MKAVIEFVKNKKCNICGSIDSNVKDDKPFLIQIDFIRICKDCLDELWKMSEGIE